MISSGDAFIHKTIRFLLINKDPLLEKQSIKFSTPAVNDLDKKSLGDESSGYMDQSKEVFC